MPRASLTPHLDVILTDPDFWASEQDYAAMRRELRAVKAVVRAAVGLLPVHWHDGGPIPNCCGCALDRALARLRRGTRATDEGGGRS